MAVPDKVFTRDEVRQHTSEDSLWCVVDSVVYDLTDFVDAHPGGESVLRQVAGQDATKAFYSLHRHEVLSRYSDLAFGTVEGEKPQAITPEHGDLSPVPYAEPLWLSPQFSSPEYYKDSHRKLQKALRVFVDKYVLPEGLECEATGRYVSQELIERMASVGILHMRLGPGKHMHGVELMGVMKGEDFDYFHELILSQEMGRVPARGFMDGNLAGMTIGLPAVLNFANNEAWKKKICDDVFSGKKKICLAITEAFAGSDVAGVRTTATKTPDGKHYIINGTKKWITNGTFCDYFVVACRNGKHMSAILVERGEGVETKPIKTSYSPAAGTAYVTFDNVKVPAGNLLGKDSQGIQIILSNFNHERWSMTCGVIRFHRFIVEECMKWANQREIFGKRLIDQPVIRQKIAKLMAIVESHQAWLESLTFQMCNMSYKQQSEHLAGRIALLKMSSTRGGHEIADESMQIWGGRGLTQSGMGKYIEMFSRTNKFEAILGGSEEILSDLGVRQAMRNFPKAML